MVRRYYKRTYRSGNKDKYSVEQYTVRTKTTDQWTAVLTNTQTSYQVNYEIVPEVPLVKVNWKCLTFLIP